MRNNNIECDTERLLTDANEIINILTEYEKAINSIFKLLNFAESNSAWTGNNAILYSNMAMQDKIDYIDYGKGIKNIAMEMKSFADDLDSTIKENEEICENSQDSYVSYYYY